MKNWAICVPTYKKAIPLCLQLLSKDPKLELNLFVRKEELESGFYKHITDKRVNFIPITNVTEIGLTRKAILDWCKLNKIKYCCMMDDGVYNIHIKDFQDTPSEVIQHCIDCMENDELTDNIVGMTFLKYEALNVDGTKVYPNHNFPDKHYFLSFPLQCFIINIDKCVEHDITYHSLDEVGFEDGAFFVDCLKAGLIFASRNYLFIDAVIPNQPKPGGNHTTSEPLETKYDRQTKKMMDYMGPFMGVSYQKRYRSYANGYLTLLYWDYDFYREVLCEKRNENKRIIDNKLKIEVI